MNWVATALRIIRRISAPGKSELNHSRLVGMYLSQANRTNSFASEFQKTRQRDNGKFTHNRERA